MSKGLARKVDTRDFSVINPYIITAMHIGITKLCTNIPGHEYIFPMNAIRIIVDVKRKIPT